jgi:hypothetical protein
MTVGSHADRSRTRSSLIRGAARIALLAVGGLAPSGRDVDSAWRRASHGTSRTVIARTVRRPQDERGMS